MYLVKIDEENRVAFLNVKDEEEAKKIKSRNPHLKEYFIWDGTLPNNPIWDKKTKSIINNDALEIEQKLKDSQNIEKHIYSKYTEKEQSQDLVWISNFTTKLVARGVENLDKQIVDFATSFFRGKTLDEVLAGVDMEVKPMYEKLVKVAIKNEWAYLCIQEGKKAIAENRDAVYPAFPELA